MPSVSIDIPEDVLLSLREQPAELSQEIGLVAAIHYFKEKRLSLGQAARFAGINRLDFLDALNTRGVSAFDLSVEDAKAEIQAAQREA